MNIIALRGFIGGNGNNISIGDIISVSDDFAKLLIKAGKAKEFIKPDIDELVKKNKKITTQTQKVGNNVAPDTLNPQDNIGGNHQQLNRNESYENNNIINSDNHDGTNYKDNVADINTQNSDADVDDKNVVDINNNDEIIDNNTDNKLTDTNVGQLDNPKTEQQDNKNNSVIIQKNTAGKK